MKITTEARLISAESKPWEIEGRSGVSHKVRVLVDTDVFVLKATEQDVARCNEYIEEENTSGELTIDLVSSKEVTQTKFVSFEPK